jgi:GAF domain-containing protein
MTEMNETGTSNLADRHTTWLRMVNEIGRILTHAGDLEDLFHKVARRVRDGFDFYHVAIYLTDRSREWAILKAAAGETGDQFPINRFKLPVGKEGVVGYVARHGEPRVIQDVPSDPFHFVNPALPETLSEAALPIRVGRQVLGVLNLQSREKAAFGEDPINVLQNIADQLAIAIENSNLTKEHRAAVSELQMTLEASRKAYSEISREAWTAYIRSRSELAFLCDSKDLIAPAPEKPGPQVSQAVNTGGKVLLERGVLALPIKIRDQIMGVVSLRKPEDEQGWTEEEIELMETLVDQLGMALESARLYDDTQKRAERERLISDITSKVRASTNLDVILQTAVQQIAEALQAPRGSIVLRGED